MPTAHTETSCLINGKVAPVLNRAHLLSAHYPPSVRILHDQPISHSVRSHGDLRKGLSTPPSCRRGSRGSFELRAQGRLSTVCAPQGFRQARGPWRTVFTYETSRMSSEPLAPFRCWGAPVCGADGSMEGSRPGREPQAGTWARTPLYPAGYANVSRSHLPPSPPAPVPTPVKGGLRFNCINTSTPLSAASLRCLIYAVTVR